MPLLDHSRPPVGDLLPWSSLLAGWSVRVGDELTTRIPNDFHVEQSVKPAVVSYVDVAATVGRDAVPPWRSDWQPPASVGVSPAFFPDRYEVRVYREFGGRQLVAVVEFMSPGNKDTETARRAFAARVVSHLHDGVCVAVVDVVAGLRVGVHGEVIRMLRAGDELRPPAEGLSAVTYRPVIRHGRAEIDLWAFTFAVGDPLPTVPLRLIADHFVPVELERTYAEHCRRRRLID